MEKNEDLYTVTFGYSINEIVRIVEFIEKDNMCLCQKISSGDYILIDPEFLSPYV
ncbi:hypothetical protein P9246_11025 [Aeribacillus pallidus]|uniref:hypothetical protein n=1 Tax=Aeribacillus composti TaxID=1868734 RepID=UPI002E201F66|nr:hypothetical protein [Aeribacillus composti]MED4487274.1 hypothetical protein [Aeribacillus pallidus]